MYKQVSLTLCFMFYVHVKGQWIHHDQEPTQIAVLQFRELDSFFGCQRIGGLVHRMQGVDYPDWYGKVLNIPRYPIEETNVTFWLFTRKNQSTGYALNTYENNLPNSSFDPKKKTLIYVTGQQRTHKRGAEILPKVLLPKEDINIIVMDYDPYTFFDTYYNRNVTIPKLAIILEKFVRQLMDYDVQPANITMIGFSVGGEVTALTSKNIKPKIGKVIAYDPAGSCLSFLPPSRRISKGDATFVQIIHCTTGDHGHFTFLGDATFYVNGGYVQPECTEDKSVYEYNVCSHDRCEDFFFDSLADYNRYIGVSCDSYKQYEKHACNCKKTSVMGYATPPNTKGTFYVNTKSPNPCKFSNGIFSNLP